MVGVKEAHSDGTDWLSAPSRPSQNSHSLDQVKTIHLTSTVRLKSDPLMGKGQVAMDSLGFCLQRLGPVRISGHWTQGFQWLWR